MTTLPGHRKESNSLMAFLDELRHAFTVAPAGPVEATDQQRVLIDRLCGEIARRRLTTPAILYLEMSRPLGFLAAQAIHFFTPLISVFTDREGHREFAEFLEQRGAIDYLLERLEVTGRGDVPRRRGDAEDVRRGDG